MISVLNEVIGKNFKINKQINSNSWEIKDNNGTIQNT
jgi:hypothetical protein